MSADNFMYIRKANGWYIVNMESASNEDGPGDNVTCYRCWWPIRPEAETGIWVNEPDGPICVGMGRQADKHNPGGYTQIFKDLGKAWQYAEDEASGKNDDFGYGTEYGVSYSEEIAKEIADRLTG